MNTKIMTTAFAALMLLSGLANAVEGTLIGGGPWKLGLGLIPPGICFEGQKCPKVDSNDVRNFSLYSLHHLNLDPKTYEEKTDAGLLFACYGDRVNGVAYSMTYLDYLNSLRSKKNAKLPVTVSADDQVKLSTTAVDLGEGAFVILPVSEKDIDALASTKNHLEVNVQGHKPYKVDQGEGEDIGFGLSTFKTLCQLQADHDRATKSGAWRG